MLGVWGHRAVFVKAGKRHSHAGNTDTWAGWAGPSGAWCCVLGRHISRGAGADGEVGRVSGMEMD